MRKNVWQAVSEVPVGVNIIWGWKDTCLHTSLEFMTA